MAQILIIDDDDLFRSMLSDLLEIEGYDVLTAANGELGVALFQQHRPDLVITDIVMPDKEGIQTIRELIKEDPDARIIAISGGGRLASAPDYLTLAIDFGARRTFSKPFERVELLQAIREILDEPA